MKTGSVKKAQNLYDFVPLPTEGRFVANEVGPKGFEPMTSALSKQRSKPAELRSRFVLANIENATRVHNPGKLLLKQNSPSNTSQCSFRPLSSYPPGYPKKSNGRLCVRLQVPSQSPNRRI